MIGPVTLTVYGISQPKGSARAFVIKGRAVVTSSNPNLKMWEQSVRAEAQATLTDRLDGEVWTGAIAVTMGFYLNRPASVSKKTRPFPTVKPDLDKLVRATLDPLTGLLFLDDAQVVTLNAAKWYTTGPAKAVITIMPFSESGAVLAGEEPHGAASPRDSGVEASPARFKEH